MIIIPNLIEIIKQSALEAIKETSPQEITFGEVESIKLLKINIEQKLTLDENHLILTSLLKDINIELDWILNQSFSDTACREYLIKRCKERGIYLKKSYKTNIRR